MSSKPTTPLLDTVNEPAATRAMSIEQLRQLSDEVRAELIGAVSVTGGHLGAGLGVVELTVALHHVFETPKDKLIWDVGHQCYPHKILTGRRDRMRTLRKGGGLSGFCLRSESAYDTFGAGHSSTSISAGVGMAMAMAITGEDYHVVPIIGDGAMSAGMAYEAMNNAGSLDSRLVVVLNDNDMSIAPPVGGMSNYLNRLLSSNSYASIRHMAKDIASHLPSPVQKAAKRAEEYARGMVTGGTLFEELGFHYVGPVDGHRLDHLVPILRNVRDSRLDKPILVHVITRKGHGYEPAEQSADKYHGVSKFDVVTGAQAKPKPNAPSYTSVFAKALIAEAEADPAIVGFTAAMPSGTGLDKVAKAFPDRVHDVGIAEQHAVTCAAGMAVSGAKPFAAIYSTFLQRAYDQVVHDVALQSLPVRFVLDRAGLVGADGATHQGAFDLPYLLCLPNMVVMAPSDEAELMHMVATQAAIDDRPSVVRYPRGEGVGVPLPERGVPLPMGKGRMVQDSKGPVAILSLGSRLQDCLAAAEDLGSKGLGVAVADARFAKPMDEDLIRDLASRHEVLLIVEEGASGGFGAHVLTFLARQGLLDKGLRVRPLTLPDVFIEHDSQTAQAALAGLTAADVAMAALKALDEVASADHPARA